MTAENIVAYCLCGCGKLVFAANLEAAKDSQSVATRIEELKAAGHLIDYASSAFVRFNWNEHEEELPGPKQKPKAVQLSLF